MTPHPVTEKFYPSLHVVASKHIESKNEKEKGEAAKEGVKAVNDLVKNDEAEKKKKAKSDKKEKAKDDKNKEKESAKSDKASSKAETGSVEIEGGDSGPSLAQISSHEKEKLHKGQMPHLFELAMT